MSNAPGRLAWLDGLRGVGALAVVGEHLFTGVMPWLRPVWFNLGVYGVLVFFLVSGYIIPVSLERHGDVRTFWVSRLARLYPLYLVIVALVVVLAWWIPLREEVPRDPAAVAAHATMLLDVVGVGGVVNTMWTLSYEMVFYLLVTALFVTGAGAARGLLPVLFGLVALVVGVAMSGAVLSGGWLAWVSAAVFAAGLAGVVSGRFRTAGACALGVLALVLLLFGSRVPWFGAAILAVMFAGSAIHRWERGAGPLWPVVVTAVLVALAPVWAINAGWWWVQPDVWIATVVLAGATFGGVMAVRRLPYALVWFGVISYSLYLVHLPVLTTIIFFTGDLRRAPLDVQIGVGAVVVVLVVPLSWLSHRFVEQPMQALGRRLVSGGVSARRAGRTGPP
ncbi:acyltransferase family protein [Nonomuraea sp. NPDC050556]|uniref:acyltransferase family protein n=1 Tax=Nonomuraea sp. NPDC050556 TaxID=3364369 RepID=UPI00379D283B